MRGVTASLLAGLALTLSVGVASAHPLGNYTVNRAVAVRVGANEVAVRYVVDMAEIPAFSAIQVMDRDSDGQTDPTEIAAYASDACANAGAKVTLRIEDVEVALAEESPPQLSFPEGAGGLPTLRLICSFVASLPGGVGERTIAVADATDDGHVGWREVTIAAGSGVAITTSDVPSQSPSASLTRYPKNSLQTPPNVRSGMARFRLSATAAGQAAEPAPAAPGVRGTANDPLAALVGGSLNPITAAAALLLALGLGAVHAASPGHGKTLVAAYLIGSRGSVRHAATLGLTVAVTHTAGVFLLGAATLLIGQWFVPERVIEWLSLGSGALVVLLGAGLVVRALQSGRGTSRPSHTHDHDHGHDHGEAHPHQHAWQTRPQGDLRPRNVVALGLAGGMVPSASALIVLLVAITTGRIVFGLLLIVAFGAGMALVLGGLAIVTTVLRRAVRAPTGLAAHPAARLVARSIPLVSGLAVLIAGLSVTIGALTRFA
jgi:ABC-type nickel/cobalt efflux system permease component RcnA